jgi:hypothetical protein
MDNKYIVNDKKTLQLFPKDVLVEKILLLQEYIAELKDRNNELINKLNGNATIISEINIFLKLESLAKEVYPLLIKMVEIVGKKDSVQKSSKGYNLVKVPNKKHGFLYYVRYLENGKLIPSKWNTHTNDIEIAKIFAEENRMFILTEYQKKHIMQNAGIKEYGNMFSILKNFYLKDSIFMKFNEQLNRSLVEKRRTTYYNIINKIFIPFLKKNKIKKFDELTTSIISKFQFYLIEKQKTPDSIIRYLNSLKYLFSILAMMGIMEKNIFENVITIKINKSKDA